MTFFSRVCLLLCHLHNRAVGWTCQSGKGETDWFFVFPNSSADDGIKGKDYFTSEFEVKQFAETVLGWKGDAIYRREKEEHDALTTGKRRATLEAVSSQHPLRTTNLTRIPSKRKNWKQNGKARPRLNAEIVEATETRKRSQHIENEIDRAVESKKSRQSQADDASNKENTYTNSQLKHSVEAEEEDCRLPRDAPQVRPTSVSSNFGEDKKKPPDYNVSTRNLLRLVSNICVTNMVSIIFHPT